MPQMNGMVLAPSLVRFHRVRKSYDGQVNAVRNLTLDVAKGELLTLLGPSGSGKTTTLMMLAGFEAPDAGEISLEGRDVTRLPPHKRGIGVVFQNFALFPHMTVAENIAFPLEVRRVGRAERAERVGRALDLVRLAGFGGRMPGQLSGGQQQRVAIARALVFNPALVLMDEPLGALDRALREEMQLEIRHLHEKLGVTMVYVTHDQAEALTLSDRIAVFSGGEIRQCGTPQEIYETPSNLFVAGFVGENNLLAGQAVAEEEDLLAVRLDCGAVVEGVAVDATPGRPCRVAIRPERIALAATSAEDMGDGAIPATLLEAIYQGDHLRLRLSIGRPGHKPAEITVKRPAGAPLSLAPGQAGAVAWQAYQARVFAA